MRRCIKVTFMPLNKWHYSLLNRKRDETMYVYLNLTQFKVTRVPRSTAISKGKPGRSIKSTERQFTGVCTPCWLVIVTLYTKFVHRSNGPLFAETLPCDQCKRIFHHPWFLQKHKQWVHSGERRMFKCTREGCQETYTTNFNLQNHVLAFHEKRRDFICLFVGCGKAFAMEVSFLMSRF